jgi:hypothetical protein
MRSAYAKGPRTIPDRGDSREMSGKKALAVEESPIGPSETIVTVSWRDPKAREQREVKTSSYHVVSPGLNVRDPAMGDWRPATVSVRELAGSVVAENGWMRATLAANPHQQGAFVVETSGGTRVRGHALGLALHDVVSGRTLMIGSTKDTTAVIEDGERVVYADAFEGLAADLVYRVTLGSVEQDVVIRQELPDPSQVGLAPDTTVVQVMTEFLDGAAPEVIPLPEMRSAIDGTGTDIALAADHVGLTRFDGHPEGGALNQSTHA